MWGRDPQGLIFYFLSNKFYHNCNCEKKGRNKNCTSCKSRPLTVVIVVKNEEEGVTLQHHVVIIPHSLVPVVMC